MLNQVVQKPKKLVFIHLIGCLGAYLVRGSVFVLYMSLDLRCWKELFTRVIEFHLK